MKRGKAINRAITEIKDNNFSMTDKGWENILGFVYDEAQKDLKNNFVVCDKEVFKRMQTFCNSYQ